MQSKGEILLALGVLAQVNENFEDCIRQLEQNANLHPLQEFQSLRALCSDVGFNNPSGTSGKYISLCLECLLSLKNSLQLQSDDKERLLSVAQQRSVKTLLEYSIQHGIVDNLLPGVEQPSISLGKLQTSQIFLTDLQKYEGLCIVTLALVDLYHNDTFHGILVPQFLSPLLCALCQLTMVPLKKSADTFTRLQGERLIFQRHLNDLITKLYQPMIIKELMVIEGNKKSAKWLKRGVGRLLTTLLHRPHGVLAVIQAVRDAANCAAPTSPAHLESVARVIMASPDLQHICPQVLSLIDSSEAELVRVAVLCIKTLHSQDSTACDTHLMNIMTRPLTTAPSTESDVSQCLHRLHKCFAVPASDLWCLPHQLLESYIQILFQLYCKIYQSASHLRKIVEDLVWNFLSKCDGTILPKILHCLIYREKVDGVKMVDGLDFVFGEKGGVKIVIKDEGDDSLEELGDCLMVLLERRDSQGAVGNNLFVTLLKYATSNKEPDTIDSLERQLLTVKLLAVLSENPAVHKSLSKNPEHVVKFLTSMINSFLTNTSHNVEIISIVLVVLNVILNDCILSKKCCWPVFSQLESPLSLLKEKAGNTELRILAEEAYNTIMTHGAVKPKDKQNVGEKRTTETPMKDSACDEALQDACDPLLPIRGHAVMQLGKLLAAGDKQARAKKDQILCIFQESLKNEDSFLYLSAVEGLALAAAEFPDTVLICLAEQFSQRSLAADTRLKVGEALVRVTKLLGELAPVYKTELINAFLSGTRDDDFLVRASSLSSLGELCRVLGFRIGSIVAEVLMCARCIVNSDPSVEVRRAAVMLICLLLKGLQKDALSVLQDVLLELYRTLKQIHASDKDDVTRLHAQLALEELNCGTLAFLFPKPQLTKQIFVLDPPA